MVRHLVLALVLLLSVASVSHAQIAPPADGVTLLLSHLELILQKNDRDSFPTLLSQMTGDRAERATEDLFSYEATRAAVRERDRQPLPGSAEGDGYRLIVEIMTETINRAGVMTVRLDVRRPIGGETDSWRIVDAERLTSVQGLYRLRLNAETQFSASNFTIMSEDLQLTLTTGAVYQVISGEGVTGLVLLGRGQMRFAPAPATEQGQLRIFTGSDVLVTPFSTAYVRLHPADFEIRATTAALRPVAVNPGDVRRARAVFAAEAPKSFNIDMRDLSSEQWYILPPLGDFLAEVRTGRHGALTYSKGASAAEDITLFDRARRRNISLYASAAKVAARGATYNEDDLAAYDVLEYNINTVVSPDKQFLEGTTQITLRVRAEALATMTLRLAEPLAVSSVISLEYGRLLFFRVRNEESLIINLPVSAQRGTMMTLAIAYSGTVRSQELDRETVELSPQGGDQEPSGAPPSQPLYTPEPSFLLSSRSAWYPQNTISDYARARVRVTVPPGYGCVGSGQLATGDVSLRDLLTPAVGNSFVFNANEPVRYLALVVSRLTRVSDAAISVRDESVPARAPAAAARAGVTMRRYDQVRVVVEANPQQQEAGRNIAPTAADIVRFFSALTGDAPYESLTVAMLEHDLPGGHSPAYFAIVNNPPPFSRLSWGNDPAAFSNVPEYFLAHEIAHQWWGQAVGWKNYHEQWVSEGISQYFAALYAQKAHGDETFHQMLRQFRRWSLSESEEGPVDLGYRLGLIKGNGRIFRALVYNKGAAVLHMLRQLLGDQVFFNGLRRFYREQKFQKAGTDDLQRAMEAESGRPLDRFFEQWIHGASLPRIRYSAVIRDGAVVAQFDQLTDQTFEVPVTVTITYADRRTEHVVVPIMEKHVEHAIPTTGTVRRVEINRDGGAVAQFERN